MFKDCSSLTSLPDISKWNTKNVENMESLFYNCSKLLIMPNISNWNICKVTKLKSMLYNCSSLINLPDLSSWNNNHNINIDSIYEGEEENIE